MRVKAEYRKLKAYKFGDMSKKVDIHAWFIENKVHVFYLPSAVVGNSDCHNLIVIYTKHEKEFVYKIGCDEPTEESIRVALALSVVGDHDRIIEAGYKPSEDALFTRAFIEGEPFSKTFASMIDDEVRVDHHFRWFPTHYKPKAKNFEIFGDLGARKMTMYYNDNEFLLAIHGFTSPEYCRAVGMSFWGDMLYGDIERIPLVHYPTGKYVSVHNKEARRMVFNLFDERNNRFFVDAIEGCKASPVDLFYEYYEKAIGIFEGDIKKKVNKINRKENKKEVII